MLPVVVALTALVVVGLVATIAYLRGEHRHSNDLVESLRAERLNLAEANERLAHLAAHDPMTGLANRAGILSTLERVLVDARATGRTMAVMFLDIDRFKSVNDSLGHAAGDQLIQVMGRRLKAALPAGCTPGRLGGDEFVVVIEESGSVERVHEIAQRLARAVGEPLELSGRLVRVSASIGVAIGHDASDTPLDLLGFANAALHQAKDSGRDRIEVFTAEIRAAMQRRIDEERALRRSIDSGDVVPFFQPEFDASTGQLVGAEILARWIRKDGTIVNAGAILTMAEDASTLEKLTAVVMQQARPVIRRLATLGLPSGFRFRVNLPHRCTPRAWRDGQVQSYLTGIDPTMVTLDVYETAVFGDLVGASGVLTDLRQQGVRVCLEDAGRSGAALSMLRSLPLDEIRVERSQVDALTSQSNDRAVVRAMVSLARDLGLRVSADGVETGAQADALLALGCTTHQGWLYSKAITAAALEDLILQRAAINVEDDLMA